MSEKEAEERLKTENELDCDIARAMSKEYDENSRENTPREGG